MGRVILSSIFEMYDSEQNYVVRQIRGGFKVVTSDPVTLIAFLYLVLILFVAVAGPVLAPYGASERIRSDDGRTLIGAPPSSDHLLGTTGRGYDVLSRLLIGTGPTLFAGLMGGVMIIIIGTSIGITAGYKGGWVDDVLMRLTDIVYSVPLLPLAIVMVSLIGIGYFSSIFIIGLILWRSVARVIRSQVLQIKEKPFILAAQATGISTPRIMIRHILPNVAPMAILYFAIGIGFTIILQSSLAFLGLVDPFRPSWGTMLQNVYNSGEFTTKWWWSVPPGILLGLTVTATLLFGRGYEKTATGRDASSMAEEGG